MKIKSQNGELTSQQGEEMLSKIYNYIMDYQKEYKQKENHSDYDKGMYMAYWTILDSVSNLIEINDIRLNIDLKKASEDYRNNV